MQREQSLSTRRAASLMGVHESTVKRWCNDGLLQFSKTQGGHRRISVLELIAFARREGASLALIPFGQQGSDVWFAFRQVQVEENFGPAVNLLFDWYRTNSSHLCKLFIDFLLEQGVPLVELLDEVFSRLFYKIGKQWENGQITIGEEHLVSYGIRETLELIGGQSSFSVPSDNVAVVGCIRGCLHEAGSLMLRVLLKNYGWDVAYLGANVPTEEFATMQQKMKANLVCVSVSMPHGYPEVRDLMHHLAHFYNLENPYSIAFGGSGIQKDYQIHTNAFKEVGYFKKFNRFLSWLETTKGKVQA